MYIEYILSSKEYWSRFTHFDTIPSTMRKDSALSFRIAQKLKLGLKRIAIKEGRSLSQVSEALLNGGVEAYEREGPKYLQRFLSRKRSTPSTQ
jgi:hypothetical protein